MKNSDIRRLLADLYNCGAENVSLKKNGHYKLKFSHGEEKALVTFGSTPSDRRARQNLASTIRRELNRIGLEDQRFTVRLILTSQPRPENAIWTLLDEWEQEEEPKPQSSDNDVDPAN
jgi:hypothetical protein